MTQNHNSVAILRLLENRPESVWTDIPESVRFPLFIRSANHESKFTNPTCRRSPGWRSVIGGGFQSLGKAWWPSRAALFTQWRVTARLGVSGRVAARQASQVWFRLVGSSRVLDGQACPGGHGLAWLVRARQGVVGRQGMEGRGATSRGAASPGMAGMEIANPTYAASSEPPPPVYVSGYGWVKLRGDEWN
jgi:hypothetical protein